MKGVSVPSQKNSSSAHPAHAAAHPAHAASHPAHLTHYQSNPVALLGPSWDGFKLNAGLIVGLVAAMLAVIIVTAGIGLVAGAVPHNPLILALILVLIVVVDLIVIAVVLAPAITRVQLASARHHQLTWAEARHGSPQVGWRLLGAALLIGLTVIGGLILLIVPGLIFAVWFSLTAYAIVDEDLGVIDGMKRSRNLVRNRFWDTAGVLAFFQAASILQVVPVLGRLAAIVLSVIFSPLQTIRYYQLVHLKKTGDGQGIPTHPANYGLVLLALIAGGFDSANQMHHPTPVRPLDKTSVPY